MKHCSTAMLSHGEKLNLACVWCTDLGLWSHSVSPVHQFVSLHHQCASPVQAILFVFLSKTLNSKSVTLHLSINPLHTNISIFHTVPIHSLRC